METCVGNEENKRVKYHPLLTKLFLRGAVIMHIFVFVSHYCIDANPVNTSDEDDACSVTDVADLGTGQVGDNQPVILRVSLAKQLYLCLVSILQPKTSKGSFVFISLQVTEPFLLM